MNKKYFYITTTAPYVNANPHIGFALEIIQADAVARFKRQCGYTVAFGFGTDEHGQKIYQKALEQKIDPQTYCDEYALRFDSLKSLLNLSYDHFIRTTDDNHVKAAQEFWRICDRNGYIYKKNYKLKYCVGCELEKTDSELVEGRCPLHPNLPLEIIEEENYFFKFSAFQKKLLDFYEKNPRFVVPDFRFNEIKTFVKKGLEDFSISRLKNKMPWGVDVPDDPEHVMYVWFDALVFYISTLGWPEKNTEYDQYWPGIQVAGKDNLRQQTAIWQAMLLAVGLPNTKQVFIHGFITSDGQKMSKSLGNIINPFNLVKTYGVDAVRYYLLKEIPPAADGDFSHSRMKEIYNADLANELGNLISRITTLAANDKLELPPVIKQEWHQSTIKQFDSYKFNGILDDLWEVIKELNRQTNDFAPWNKQPEERKEFLRKTLFDLHQVGYNLQPFLPETAQKIIDATSGKIKKAPALFPRLSI